MVGRIRTVMAMAAAMTAASLLIACTDDDGRPDAPAPVPTATTESPAPSTSGPPPTETTLTVYLVLIGDDGASGEPIGCGDSLVPVPFGPIETDDPLRAGISRLLEAPEGEVLEQPYYTAVPHGTLAYVDGGVEADGTVIVELTGAPLLGGACDAPRIEAQLERTAMAATGAAQAQVLVDGVPLEEVLGSY